MIYWNDDEEVHAKIIRFNGQSKEPDREQESGLLSRFRRALSKIGSFKLGFRAGPLNLEVEGDRQEDKLREAEADKALAEAKKYAAEAAEIQARMDEAPLVKATKQNEELRKIFRDEKTPEEIKFLQLLNLLDTDPTLDAQVDKIAAISSRLIHTRGAQISMGESQVTFEEPRKIVKVLSESVGIEEKSSLPSHEQEMMGRVFEEGVQLDIASSIKIEEDLSLKSSLEQEISDVVGIESEEKVSQPNIEQDKIEVPFLEDDAEVFPPTIVEGKKGERT